MTSLTLAKERRTHREIIVMQKQKPAMYAEV
jgi:hypothetical protein